MEVMICFIRNINLYIISKLFNLSKLINQIITRITMIYLDINAPLHLELI